MELINATKNGDIKIIKEFLTLGANVDSKDGNDSTPLMYASQNGSLDLIKLFVENGADIHARNKEGVVPLMYATESGNADAVKFLIKNGADVNSKSFTGWTPLMFAAKNLNTDLLIFELLIENGADVEAKNDKNWTVLMFVAYYSKSEKDRLKIIEYLINKGANVNNIDITGWSLLSATSSTTNKTSSLEAVKLLLEYGADVNIKDQDGDTALHESIILLNSTSTIETVKLLLEYGADPFDKNISNHDILSLCPNSECKKLVSKNMWNRMYKNIKLLSQQYSRSGIARFPKDVWELILLRNKQKQLCKTLSSDTNKDILINFALLLDIPINKKTSKKDLCNMISKQLSYGERYSQKSVDYFKNKEIHKNIIKAAKLLGVDVDQSIDNILNDISFFVINFKT